SPSPILSPASSLHQLHIPTICKRHRTTVIYQLCSRFCSFLVSVRYPRYCSCTDDGNPTSVLLHR
ncbi:hypothetical protein LINPERPRIM_LOCUS20811, partial [Linum perenne]